MKDREAEILTTFCEVQNVVERVNDIQVQVFQVVQSIRRTKKHLKKWRNDTTLQNECRWKLSTRRMSEKKEENGKSSLVFLPHSNSKMRRELQLSFGMRSLRNSKQFYPQDLRVETRDCRNETRWKCGNEVSYNPENAKNSGTKFKQVFLIVFHRSNLSHSQFCKGEGRNNEIKLWNYSKTFYDDNENEFRIFCFPFTKKNFSHRTKNEKFSRIFCLASQQLFC